MKPMTILYKDEYVIGCIAGFIDLKNMRSILSDTRIKYYVASKNNFYKLALYKTLNRNLHRKIRKYLDISNGTHWLGEEKHDSII